MTHVSYESHFLIIFSILFLAETIKKYKSALMLQ